MAKLPSFQFYPGDWMKDPALRSCTLAARGVYVDLLCLMFESPQRGVLRQNRAPMRLQLIASMVQKARPSHVKELIDKGVLKVARKDGAVYSKRMVRDELRRRHLSAKGRLGGLAKACLNPAQPLANTLPKPSSSSSSSSSTSVKEETPPNPPLKKGGDRNRRRTKKEERKADLERRQREVDERLAKDGIC